MSVTSTPTTTLDTEGPIGEAPLTLTTEPPRPLGFTDQLALWGNLGISLFGPLTGALIATTAGSVGLALGAIVVGCGIGAILLGASAVFGATTGAPPWSRFEAWSAAAARCCRHCSTLRRTSAGRRWRSS